jgi:hypothetical protein
MDYLEEEEVERIRNRHRKGRQTGKCKYCKVDEWPCDTMRMIIKYESLKYQMGKI